MTDVLLYKPFQLAPDVWLYPKVLTSAVCEAIVEAYEKDDRKAPRANRTVDGFSIYRKADILDMSVLAQDSKEDTWRLLDETVAKSLGGVIRHHFNVVYGLETLMPGYKDIGYEVGCYRPPDGGCELHMDGLPGVYPVLTSIVIYLNTMTKGDGGETVFPRFDLAVRPIVGAVLLFPPHFTHIHGANKVKKSRYFINSRVILAEPVPMRPG